MSADSKEGGILLSQKTLENIHHCNKCGLCLAACPVYKEILLESVSPRGKVQLSRRLLEGDLEITPRLKEILSQCLLCGSCVSACPSGVQGEKLFSGLRWRAAQRLGIDWRKRLLFQLLAHRWLIDCSTRIASWARAAVGKWLEREMKFGALPLSRIPQFNPEPFSKEISEITTPAGEIRARVLYFHGCATNYIFGEVGRAVVEVLSEMAVEVIIPKKQGCCGVPIFLSGAREDSLRCIEEVLEQFSTEEADAVIVDCATCGLALSREYPYILEELKELGQDVRDDLLEKAKLLASKTQDIMAFVGDHMNWLPDMSPQGPRLRVTYHDPCHLLKGQGVGLLPRKVLASLPNVEFVEMEAPDGCCGGGGAFQVEHPEISLKITSRKIKNIEATGASVVATGCPGCRITIGAHLDSGKHIRVLHPIQLVKMALEGASSKEVDGNCKGG